MPFYGGDFMKKKSEPQNPSRRNFLKNVGVGTIGGAILTGTSGKAASTSTAIEPDSGPIPLRLKVNGDTVNVSIHPETTLVEVIRDHLGLTATKIACNRGECGTCTVLLDGKAVYSCHLLALDAADKEVTTLEGLMDGEKLHPIQEAFLAQDGLQCGFCTPGQIMTAAALLNEYPEPSEEQISIGMSGTICRCAAYPNIAHSVKDASRRLKKPGGNNEQES